MNADARPVPAEPAPAAGAATLPRHLRLLAEVLADPSRAVRFTDGDWDLLLRVARSVRLLGLVGARLAQAGDRVTVPAPVAAHFESERRLEDYRCHQSLRLTHEVVQTLAPIDAPIVLLKGIAYLRQDLWFASTRAFADVDILVPRVALDQAEARLNAVGWSMQPTTPYDDRYYRQWSHELPPMEHPGHAMELDLHHAIVPPIGHLKLDMAPLLAAARTLPGQREQVLAPEDQVLHAACHLFQDSDLTGRLRDLVDIWLLVEAHAETLAKACGAGEKGGVRFARQLAERALALGVARPLWYSLHFVETLLGATPVVRSTLDGIRSAQPGLLAGAAMDWMAPAALWPPGPETGPGWPVRLARLILVARYYLLRMPLPKLIQHILVKSWRALTARRTEESAE